LLQLELVTRFEANTCLALPRSPSCLQSGSVRAFYL
jgi:hypothetical protein